MFTGIVQSMAKIVSIDEKRNFRQHTIELDDDTINDLETGDSISQNGCCLTVTEINGNYVSFDLLKETLRITNLGKSIIGDWINIERAAKLSDEVGGHLMSGHIMTMAEIKKILILENNYQLYFELKDHSLMKYLLYKGFIGVDGISLTVGEVNTTGFCVHLIPETLKRTTIGTKKIGQHVNIEIDLHTQSTINTVERILLSKNALLNKILKTSMWIGS